MGGKDQGREVQRREAAEMRRLTDKPGCAGGVGRRRLEEGGGEEEEEAGRRLKVKD